MPTSRRALLISNPGEIGAENYCKGVYVDIRNYTRLLLSPQGGSWDPSEIRHLDRPTAQNVRDWLAYFSTHDYVLVMFTGHGWYSSVDRDRILELGNKEKLQSIELRKGSSKRTIILDCCQKVYAESIFWKQQRCEHLPMKLLAGGLLTQLLVDNSFLTLFATPQRELLI